MTKPNGNLNSKPRLAFIGAGWIGQSRMRSLLQAGAAEAAVICEPDPANARAALARAPGAVLARDFEEAISGGAGGLREIDGVVIATPSSLHADQAIAALERGLPVFCQKPLGRNGAEARRVVEAARRANRLLAVDLSYRFTRAAGAIRDLLAAGAIGEVFAANLVFHNAYGPDKPWYYDRALSGGGCVLDLGVHLVDLALWCLGFPAVEGADARLYARGTRVERGGEVVEDFAAATLDLDTGAAVSLACSWGLRAGCDAIIGAQFHGTEGGLSFMNVNGSFYDFRAERFHGASRETLVEPPDDWGGEAALAWARRLARSPEYDSAADRIQPVADVLDMIYAAGARKRRAPSQAKEALTP